MVLEYYKYLDEDLFEYKQLFKGLHVMEIKKFL
jgi:hypothetical protein